MTTISTASHGGGCSLTVFRRGTQPAVRSCLVARGTMTTNSYHGFVRRGFSYPFFVETLLCCPVASWCTRNDGNDILPQALSGGCSSLFSARFVLLRRIFGTWNDDNDILSAVAEVIVTFFRRGTTIRRLYAEQRQRHLNDVNRAARRGCSSPFPSLDHYKICCPVASWSANDDNDILPRPRGGGCSSLFPSRPYSAVRSRLGASGKMTTTSYRGHAGGGCSSPFFRRGHYTAVRSRLGTRNDDNDMLPRPRGGGCSSTVFRRGTTLLSGRVLLQKER
ncbi:hypothetical protein TNCV_3307751 [Trichonephila clavipes]|nr:hypothetical protein TNCV_3307751 [Trichonephila clavipes]